MYVCTYKVVRKMLKLHLKLLTKKRYRNPDPDSHLIFRSLWYILLIIWHFI